MKNQKAAFSQNAPIKITTPSLEFFKPTVATTLAIVLVWLLLVRPAQAGYVVTLQQVGPNVVATGSGAINLTGLTLLRDFGNPIASPAIKPFGNGIGLIASRFIYTGPTSSSVDFYGPINGPTSFGSAFFTHASSGSGDMVGINGGFEGAVILVPKGYVSGTPLSDSAIYSDASLATLHVTPGTYVWTWGKGANQNFTLKILDRK